MISNRETLGLDLNRMALTGTGVEVGSACGEFARKILRYWQGHRLFLVDPWAPQDPSIYRERQTLEHEKWYEECLALAKEDKRVTLLEMLSLEAAPHFSDGFLDFVYIDGNHAYGQVLADMDAWWPKIVKGGVMGGHDFLNKTDNGWFCEVQNAVLRWTKEHKVSFYLTPCTSFWIHKV